MFRAIISPILRSTRLCLQLVVWSTDDTAGWWHQPAVSSVFHTTSCKHSLVLLRMGEIIARNMWSWFKLLINCYCCIWLVVYMLLNPKFLVYQVQETDEYATRCTVVPYSVHIRSTWNNLQHPPQFLLHDTQDIRVQQFIKYFLNASYRDISYRLHDDDPSGMETCGNFHCI